MTDDQLPMTNYQSPIKSPITITNSQCTDAPTAGGAALNGLLTNSDLMDVFKSTGFCPQLKGLWPSLTLRQHLVITRRLRGNGDWGLVIGDCC